MKFQQCLKHEENTTSKGAKINIERTKTHKYQEINIKK